MAQVQHFPIISTHTPLARRDFRSGFSSADGAISTHTPLARRDQKFGKASDFITISTHTPLARRDIESTTAKLAHEDFYSHASRKA